MRLALRVALYLATLLVAVNADCSDYDGTSCATCNTDGDEDSLLGCWWCEDDQRCHAHGTEVMWSSCNSKEGYECEGLMEEYSPVDFLYHAGICIVQGAVGTLSSVPQLLSLLGTMSVGDMDATCSNLVSSIATEGGGCDANRLCTAMGPSGPECEVLFTAICVVADETPDPCDWLEDETRTCVIDFASSVSSSSKHYYSSSNIFKQNANLLRFDPSCAEMVLTPFATKSLTSLRRMKVHTQQLLARLRRQARAPEAHRH